MLGLAAAALVLALWWQPAWLHATENAVFNWLRERNVLVSWLPENAAERATAMELSQLPADQAAVAVWLANKYRVAPSPWPHWWPRPTLLHPKSSCRRT